MIARLLRAAFGLVFFAALASAFEPPRPPMPQGSSPADRPWNRDVHRWTSTDGTIFRDAGVAIPRAGVPCVIDDWTGRLVAVFQWFPFDDRAAFDRIAFSTSTDGGRTWSPPARIAVDGLPGDLQRPFDPTIVRLRNGRFRLYFTSSPRGAPGRDPRLGPPPMRPAIYSAIGDTPGRFTMETGVRSPDAGAGVVDASVVRFRGRWHLFAHPHGGGARGAGYHAVSEDGLDFRRVEDVVVPGGQWIGNAFAESDELLRYFGAAMGAPGGSGSVWSGRSRDGMEWTREPGPRARGGDASVARLRDGSYLMLVVGDLRSDASDPPFRTGP